MLRFLRYLRIAFSVTCGIACVLLIVLWVRSHYRVDLFALQVTQSKYAGIASVPDAIGIGLPGGAAPAFWGSEPADGWLAVVTNANGTPWSGATHFAVSDGGIFVPYWFGVLSTAILAALPWLQWSKRFSLRTLLIVTTLVAVVLGLIAWSIR